MYTAACLSNTNLTRQGFGTVIEAEKYIVSHNCKLCVDEGINSACAAEWLVMPDVEYGSANSLKDLFIASGYKEI